MNKSKNHAKAYLPENSQYAHMTESTLLLTLAKDLREELKKKPNSFFSFGTHKMKNSKVLKEIEELTPLGKEIVGNWFMGVKKNLDFLHRNSKK